MFSHQTPSSSSSASGMLCQCGFCMNVDALSEKEVREHGDHLRLTMVYRQNPDNPTGALMQSTRTLGMIQAGSSVDMQAVTGLTYTSLRQQDFQAVKPQEITLQATWRSHADVKAITGSDASVFGSLGVLIVSSQEKTVSIPSMNALSVPAAFLKKYGAELLPLDQPVSIEPALHESLQTLYVVEYHFNENYINDYILKMQGGGGVFVETHPFPQIFTPLSPACSGALILGIESGAGTYTFSAFQIPFGYTLKIESMAIHGDSFFVGPYAIALVETKLADSVALRRDTPEHEIQDVGLVAVTPDKVGVKRLRWGLFDQSVSRNEVGSSYAESDVSAVIRAKITDKRTYNYS